MKKYLSRSMKRVGGWTPAMFHAAVEAQAGLCAVCCRPMRPKFDTHMDHDHETGRPRALLCSNCNLMLGHAKDNPSTLMAGAAYLERAREA